MMKFLIIIFVFLSCSDHCELDSLRCDGNTLEVCDLNERWVTEVRCETYKKESTGESCGLICCDIETDAGLSADCRSPELCEDLTVDTEKGG